jgi:plastocyanin
MFRLPRAAGPILGVGLLLAACAPQASAEPVATNVVDLPPSYRFAPEAITVPDGTTVTWTNNDNFTHTVKVDGEEDHKVGRGDSVSIKFDKPGSYHYVCTLHSKDMDGTVVVT